MQKALFGLLLTALSLPAFAQTYGGFGASLQTSDLNWRVPGQIRGNAVGCIGGMAYGVKDGNRRGGEGHYCSGRFATMAMGGMQIGKQGRRGGKWLTGYATLGGGYIGLDGRDGSRFDGAFAYARPSIGAGTALRGWGALEGSLFLTVPVTLVGVTSGIDPKVVFPHAGIQGTLLFGDFRRRSRAAKQPRPEVRGRQRNATEDQPLAIPGRTPESRRPRKEPTPAPPARPAPSRPSELPPARPSDLPPATAPSDTDELPLAIPDGNGLR